MAERTCSVEECDRPSFCKGWCSMHYQRARLYGDPLYRRPSIADRYWAKVDRSGGCDACWPWTAATDDAGYGRFGVGVAVVRAHRLGYELHYGPLGQLYVCHRCDNPPCQNPRHLYAGTQLDNASDRESRGRGNPGYVPGEANGMSKLSESDVLEIRAQAADGMTHRHLARQYMVAKTTITDVVRRRTWAHI